LITERLNKTVCAPHADDWHFLIPLADEVTGQNGSGQNGTDKMVRIKW